jgi:hypothetical protein
LLLAVLGLTRLFVVRMVDGDIEIREVEIAVLPEPPPPPPEDPPPAVPPPPTALANIVAVPDATRVPVPRATVPVAIDAPVDLFSADVAPAPMPPPVARPKPRPAVKPTPRPTPRATPKPRPPPAVKSHYSAAELDGQPRLLRHGSASFPVALSRKGVTRGTVTLEVELSERGAVRVRRVISATHPELVSGAKRVAAGSRFTVPKKNGRAVRAIMRWPITIKK